MSVTSRPTGVARTLLALAVTIVSLPPAAAWPATIVGRMGIEMTAAAARHGIAFTPFLPAREITTVALLPPFRGDDIRANRGIGFEFVGSDGHRYALTEWPANGGSVERFPLLEPGESDCPQARSFSRGTRPSGIVWSTTHGLIMSLQADGENDARTLIAEWKKLIRRGVCRV